MIASLQDTATGPGQWLARDIIARVQQLLQRGKAVEIYWVPGYRGIQGNKREDEVATMLAKERGI